MFTNFQSEFFEILKVGLIYFVYTSRWIQIYIQNYNRLTISVGPICI